jgi:hypothetical protein
LGFYSLAPAYQTRWRSRQLRPPIALQSTCSCYPRSRVCVETRSEGLTDGLCVGLFVGVSVDGLGVGVAVGMGVGVAVGMGVGVAVGEGDGVGLGEGDGVGLGEGDGVGVGVGFGMTFSTPSPLDPA